MMWDENVLSVDILYNTKQLLCTKILGPYGNMLFTAVYARPQYSVYAIE